MKRLRSVLIVDDSEDDIEISTYFLRSTKRCQEIRSARDGTEALAMFRDAERLMAEDPEGFPPTLIILDINMPKMGGFEFLDALMALDLKLDVPPVVVMLTSSQYRDDLARAEAAPVVKRYLEKPLSRKSASQLVDDFGSLLPESS